jgi:transposase-like protein
MPGPTKVSTPGSYKLAKNKEKKKKKRGWPSLAAKKKSNRKNNYRSRYTTEDLKRAVNLVTQEAKSVAAAALACGVPRVTLLDKLNGKHKTGMVGRPCVLSKMEEKVLVEILVLMGKYNYPLPGATWPTWSKITQTNERYIVSRLKNNRPEKAWIQGTVSQD